MESNALGSYNIVLRYTERTNSINRQIVRFCCGSISPKVVLISFKNFFDFSDTIEKQDMIILNGFRFKNYNSLVLCDSEVTFGGKVAI